MKQPTPDARSAVLRAAGHDQAADMLDALAGVNQPAAHTPEPAAPPEGEQTTRDVPLATEAEIVRDAMRRQIGDGGWINTGTIKDSAA